ncbi:MAG: DNA-binding transcriptional regulator [Pirellulales bacterium]|nr:DNA-binding transcriptional regulator [Pirellulales bacterium]
MQSPKIPQILLLIETSSSYSRGILEGIGHYVREHGPWSIFFEERGLEEPPPHWLKTWDGGGIIARTATPTIDRRLRATGLPRVELLGLQANSPAKVHGDNHSGGRMAAEHLIDCGLRHFGFFSCIDAWWVAHFRRGFCHALKQRRFPCIVYRSPVENRRLLPRWRESQRKSALQWLRSLPRPVGVFSPSNDDARIVLEMCKQLNIAVPEHLAVLGAGDDPAICCVTTPPLSSIDFDSKRVGYQAAALLDRLMAGFATPKTVQWIPPARVVVRQSTDIVAIEDPDVGQAVRFIRQHACNGIDVHDVTQAVPLSRRGLERRFQKFLGRTPKEEILRVQIDRVKMLLADTILPIRSIAEKSGFFNFRYFAKIFRREVGMTPRAYRQSHYHSAKT